MRIALGLQYDGTHYMGFQSQPDLPTVQGCLDAAISQVANEPIVSVCAGRTDAGVHASGQVVHFNTQAEREMHGWVMGINSNLPEDISVSWAKLVPEDFHARYSAKARRYRYTVYNAPNRQALDHRFATWHRKPLDAKAMQQAAQCLLGEHDFSAFRSVGCQAKSTQRHVQEIAVRREGDYVILDIKANAFLYNMVRNIMGSLLEVGQGDHEPAWIAQVLESKQRTLAGQKAAPNGLNLIEISYL